MPQLIVILLSIIVFSALVISMGLKKRGAVRITGALVAIVLVLGAVIYGSCFGAIIEEKSIAVVKTVNAMIEMFLGKDSIGDIQSAPLMQHLWFKLLVYAAHILAMYVTISSVLIAIAMRMLSRMRLALAWRGDLVYIYGVSEDSLSFAEKLHEQTKASVVFIGDNNSYSYESAILRMGAVLMAGEAAASPDAKLIKKTGMRPGNRKLSVYCISEDAGANKRFAAQLAEALKESGVQPQQTTLSAILKDEESGAGLLATEDSYGYGSVLAVGPMDLCARLLIANVPPYGQMSFAADGAAEEDFEALVLGFGRTGKAVLRALLMNSQFFGSSSKYYIVSKDGDTTSGNFFARYPAIKELFNAKILGCNARSSGFYEFLAEHADKIKYIAVCTGDKKENAEVADEIESYFAGRGLQPAIVECHKSGIITRCGKDVKPGYKSIYDPVLLDAEKQDAAAKIINHWYWRGSGKTAEEAWLSCDYFSRMSCRAAAEYMDAFLAQAHMDRRAAAEEGLGKDPQLLENLAQSEHLRWMAFHAAMGYRPMPAEVYDAREAQFLKEKAEDGKGRTRVGKDTKAKLHACIIPWEELDALSERESRAKGTPVDYKQMDRDNVLAIKDQLMEIEK